MIYIQLFISYLKIGFFGFGGGYAMLSLIQNEIVVRNQWLTNNELADIIAISQMTPGPIAINSATYVGYTITGSVWGAVLATFAVCLPAMTIMVLVTRFYLRLHNNAYVSAAMRGMQPMMIGMIAAAALMLLTPDTFVDVKSWLIFAVCFLASIKKVNPILLIVLSGVAGYLLYYPAG
ncbi:MAG: chromate transporter [Alistipes sp.]|nr:chromate transporter [Alistipes sp.]